MDAHHRELDDVGGGALDDRVDGQALAERAHVPALRPQLGDRPAAAEQRDGEAALARVGDRALDELGHERHAAAVGVDVGLRLVALDLELLREAVGADAVDDPEVDRLGAVALVLAELAALLAEHLGRRDRVDVLAALEGLAQQLLAREVGEDAQLDLRVVDREQAVPGRGHERRAQLAPERRADRDVLQVRALRREPARSRP